MSLTADQKSLLRKALAHARDPDDAQVLVIYLIHHAEWHRLRLALDFLHDIRAREEHPRDELAVIRDVDGNEVLPEIHPNG